jgi:hypothetical protein
LMVSLLSRNVESKFELAGVLRGLSARAQNAKDIVLAHDDVLGAIQLGLAAGVLSKKDAITDLDVESDQFAVLKPLAMADGNYFAFLRFLFCRVGDDEALVRGFFFLGPLHQDAVG